MEKFWKNSRENILNLKYCFDMNFKFFNNNNNNYYVLISFD